MNTFETSLLTELREHVATRSAAEPGRSSRMNRLRWSALPAGGVAAAAIAMVVIQSPASAYAVTKADDGNVVVTIDKLSDAAGLQQALRADGIHAIVNYDATFVPPAPVAPAGNGGPEFGNGPGPQLTTSGGPGTSLNSSGTAVSGSAQKGCGSPGPVQVSVSSKSVTFNLGSPEATDTSTLYITTSGSQSSGLSGIQIRWVC
jgi:hypothetical protein